MQRRFLCVRLKLCKICAIMFFSNLFKLRKFVYNIENYSEVSYGEQQKDAGTEDGGEGTRYF